METTSQEKLLLKIAEILQNLEIDYFVTGGFAVSVWGRPRATFDIDIIVKLEKPKASVLAKALRGIVKAGYADEEMIKEAIENKGEFNFIDPENNLKVDFWADRKENASDRPEFENKKLKKIGNQDVYFVSPEDLILSKLEWYKLSQSSRHLEDIESVFRISGEILDRKYLKRWTEKLGFSDLLGKLES